MTSQKFFIWLSKCPFSQPFIWGAAIGRTCFGSRDIWLLNFDHVTTWSRDFFKKIQIAHATPHPRGNWLWGIFFVHSLNPGRIVPPKNYHVVYRYIYIYSTSMQVYRGLAGVFRKVLLLLWEWIWVVLEMWAVTARGSGPWPGPKSNI